MATAKAPTTYSPQQQIDASRYSTVGPTGTTSWDQGEVIGKNLLGNPIYRPGSATQTTTLNPSEQRQLEGRNAVAESMISGAQGSAGELNTPFSFNNQGSNAAKALYQRQVDLMAPDIKMNDERFEDRMANAGIPVGSDAYNEAMRGHDNDKNFALNQASQQSEEMGANLALQERQQRFSELAQALSGGTQAPNAPDNAGDASGAFANANDAELAKYNGRVASANQTNGALTSAAMMALMAFSDERLKDDIEEVGEMPTGEGIYEYHYKWEDEDDPKHTGVMAQEIEANYPDAVVTTKSGYKAVNYGLIAQAMAA